jgi:hypothetical protein
MKTKARMIHIGKKVPKGFEELPGGMHLGKGIWALPMKPKEKKK